MSAYSTALTLVSEFFCSRGYESFLSGKEYVHVAKIESFTSISAIAMISGEKEPPRLPPVALYSATLWSIVKNDESKYINEAVKLIIEICRRVPDIGTEKRSRQLVLDLKCRVSHLLIVECAKIMPLENQTEITNNCSSCSHVHVQTPDDLISISAGLSSVDIIPEIAVDVIISLPRPRYQCKCTILVPGHIQTTG